MNFLKRFGFLAVALSCAACASSIDSDTPTYRMGYADGCESGANSGHQPAYTQRNDAMFSEDEAYHSGWLSGRAACAATTPKQ